METDTEKQVPGNNIHWRVILSLFTSLSFLFILIAKISFRDQIELLGITKNMEASIPDPQIIPSPLYIMALILFLALIFLPQVTAFILACIKKLRHTQNTKDIFDIDKYLRLIYVFIISLLVATPALVTVKQNFYYILFFAATAFAFGLSEHVWRHPFVRALSQDKTPDLPLPSTQQDDQIELYKIKLELLKFEDNKWWRAFQFLWAVLIAIAISGSITVASSQDQTMLGNYSSKEIIVLFIAGFLVLPPFILYFAKKANTAHTEMERIYNKIEKLLEEKVRPRTNF